MARARTIPSLAPDDLLHDAVQKIVAVRSDELCHFAAAQRRRPSADGIHDLRVAVRRLTSLLKVFRNQLPAEDSAQVSQRLKSLLATLGKLRETDVFIAQVVRMDVRPDVFIISMLRSERRSRAVLAADASSALEGFETSRFSEQLKEFAARPDGGTGNEDRVVTFRQDGRGRIRPLAERFARRRERALTHPAMEDELHRLRIAGKALRYAMEVFAGCYGALFREALRSIESLVEQLGTLHDFDVFIERVGTHCANARTRGEKRPPSCRELLRFARGKRRRILRDILKELKKLGGRRLVRRITAAMDDPRRSAREPR